MSGDPSARRWRSEIWAMSINGVGVSGLDLIYGTPISEPDDMT
jgi:hypothetical protein